MVRWIAILSDGNVAIEREGEFEAVPGEPSPWVKLVNKLDENHLYLKGVAIQTEDRLIHLPEIGNRFSFGERTVLPKAYSLQYIAEKDDLFHGGSPERSLVDVGAHFNGYIVHYIQNLNPPYDGWISVTEEYDRLAKTPDLEERDG